MDFLKHHIGWVAACTFALFLFGGYGILFSAPANFSAGSIVTIARGASAPQVAEQLGDARIVAHPWLLRFMLRVTGISDNVQAGTYRFEKPQNVVTVAIRLATGAYGFPPMRVTFVEGMTVREAAGQVATALPGVSEEVFLNEAQPYEGYLFPDTYLLSPSSDAATVIELMRANFTAKIATITDEMQGSGRPLSDIVILASLIEKEARTPASKRMVAGILNNRLRLGMPLQVDAVFGYIFGRDTYSPSFADLKVDSPYNTYTHTGLPPGPINNPGLDSLEAAANPAKTDYLYYLTGNDDLMHYATTYAGHLANQRKYLP